MTVDFANMIRNAVFSVSLEPLPAKVPSTTFWSTLLHQMPVLQ